MMNSETRLDSCLDEIETGRKTLADCIAEHPDLERALRVAQHLRVSPTPGPRPETLRRFEAQLRRAIPPRRPFPRLTLALRQVVMASLVVALVAGSGYGVALAAPTITPEGPLYTLKRTVEAVATQVAPSAQRPDVYLAQAQQRLAEIEILVKRPDTKPVTFQALLTDLTTATDAALRAAQTMTAEQQAGVLTEIVYATTRQSTALHMFTLMAPANARSGFEQALTALAQHRNQAATLREQLLITNN